MKKLLLSFIIISVASNSLNAQCAATGNILSFAYNGTNYEIVKEMKTWAAAATCAVERGGYLVHINDSAEQVAIYNAISASGISTSYTATPDGGGVAYIWIGATDKQTEGIWKWDGDNDSTGTNFWTGQGTLGSGGGVSIAGAYSNWGGLSTSGFANEPDDYNNNQDAAAIGLAAWPATTTNKYGYAGDWNDININNQLYYVIEKNPTGIEQTDTYSTINVYPNPARETLHISCEKNMNGRYSLYSIQGMKICEGTAPGSINLTDYTPGQYFLHLVTEFECVTKNITVIH